MRVRVSTPLAKVIDPQTQPLTPRRAAYLLVLRSENRGSEETAVLEKLSRQDPDLTLLIDLTDEFLQLLSLQQPRIKILGC